MTGKYPKYFLNGFNDRLVKIQKELDGRIGGLNCFFSSENYLEFTAEEATKGKAMKALADRLGIDIAQTIAMGDSFNDMSMIETAGLGVAVRNAVQPLKDASDYITKIPMIRTRSPKSSTGIYSAGSPPRPYINSGYR